jgi:ligand-binding sensor domain-containing protein/CheY-like chemotaxis protein/nitrogen-specific signal transduction histidine kinase
LLVILGLCFANTADAQLLHCHNIGEAEGLPDVRVTDFDQGPDGRIWIAARSAIFAYDGQGFTTYSPGESLPERFVPERIAVDSTSTVWTSGLDRAMGILRFTNGIWEEVEPPPWPPVIEAVRDIDILETPGQIPRLVLVADGVAQLWDEHSWSRVERPKSHAHHSIRDVHAFEGKLFFATTGGVEVLSEGASQTTPLYDLPQAEDYLVAVQVERTATGARRIWVAGSSWLGYVQDGALVRAVEVEYHGAAPSGPTIQLLEDGHGGLYFGSFLRLHHYDADTGKARQLDVTSGLMGNGVNSLMRDMDENVWICSLRGVTRVPPQRFRNYDHTQGLLQDEVTAVLESRPGHLVFGHEWGLSYLEPDGTFSTTTFEPDGGSELTGGRVLTMAPGEGNEFFIAVDNHGLGRATFGGDLEWIEGIPPTVMSVARDSDGRHWISTYDGVWVREIDGRLQFDDDLGRMGVRRVQVGIDGTLWASTTRRGLFVRRDGGWKEVQPANDMGSEVVYSVLADRQGITWVGTDSGLFRFEEGVLRLQSLGFRIRNPVYAVLEQADGTLWFGTARGVARWDGSNLERLGPLEGLVSGEVNRGGLIEDSRGQVWIGTDRGVSRYLGHPEREIRSPEVEILDLRWSDPGTSHWHKQPIGGYSDLEISFRAISFEGTGNCAYRARLIGFDEGWQPERAIGAGELRYTNLPPGEYQVELQSRSENGNWGPITSSAAFTVSSPLWQRGRIVALGLGLLSILAVTALGLVIARRRSKGLAVEVQTTHEALETTEQQYGEIFERSPSILLLLKPESGRIIAANHAAATYFGQSPSALRSLTLGDLTGLPEEHYALGRERLEAGQEWIARPAEVEPVFGAPVEIRASQFPLSNENTVQVTVFDIEAQERELQERLETQKLRAVGELASGAAHDFNNLLTAILGHNELIEMDLGDEARLKAHVAQIRSAGAQGARLVRRLQAFGRKQRLHVQVLDLAQVTREAEPLLRSVLGKTLPLELSFEGPPLTLNADRAELEEILVNLALAVRDASSQRTTLTMRGKLIPANELPNGSPGDNPSAVFVRLELLVTEATSLTNDSRPPSLEILELGMQAAQDLVKQWHGSLQPDPSGSSTLRIVVYFPATQVEPAEPQLPPTTRSDDLLTDLSSRTILIVDDEPHVRQTISALLRRDGYRPLEAADAKEARRVLKDGAGDIALILTDIQMPGESGRELGQSLRRTHPVLPVLYMSGYYDEATGSVDEFFISKPFTLAKFELALHRAGLQRT